MVHFALSLMHSHAQNLGLELHTPEPVVPFVGLCLAYFFFPFMCTRTEAWLNFSHLKTDCFCNIRKLCSHYLRFLFWNTSDSAARKMKRKANLRAFLQHVDCYQMTVLFEHIWGKFGKTPRFRFKLNLELLLGYFRKKKDNPWKNTFGLPRESFHVWKPFFERKKNLSVDSIRSLRSVVNTSKMKPHKDILMEVHSLLRLVGTVKYYVKSSLRNESRVWKILIPWEIYFPQLYVCYWVPWSDQ